MAADDITVSKTIRPITRRNLSGELYFRPVAVEDQIRELLMLSQSEILDQLSVRNKGASGYLLDETIVYLLREADRERDTSLIESLFAEISARVAKLAKSKRHVDPKIEDVEDMAQDAILFLLERIFEDSDRADFAEVRFGLFISSFLKTRRAELQQRYNDDKSSEHLDETNPDGHDFELESGQFAADNELVIREAYGKLRPDVWKAAVLIFEGFKIESKDPDEATVCRMMGVSSRTIRNWMEEAKETLSEIRGMGR